MTSLVPNIRLTYCTHRHTVCKRDNTCLNANPILMGKASERMQNPNGYSIHRRKHNCDNESEERTNCFAFYRKLPKSESFHTMQLALLNSGLMAINSDHTNSAINQLIPQTRQELSKFRRYVQRIRKFDVLTRIEYKTIFISKQNKRLVYESNEHSLHFSYLRKI
ncbi:unnamed protein product [Medioppia subpectinata]|uniref:Uncharacterized protein n=1 Tax=Medioppia subpectinata TaxID=1979941 RepID=A0A7R9KG25_9ACAR|nr:unnamed protein product [Medioppia subpectinata]CAG2102692.1 unnamed protein product [Medioppia subpectinata]